jgi:hypothetical protein
MLFPRKFTFARLVKKKVGVGVGGFEIAIFAGFFEISLPGRHILFINAKTWHMLIKRWFNGPAHSRKPQ